MWPSTMAFDIGKYLESIDDIPLRRRLMSDYKDQKAYSYFASGWMEEIQYHPIDNKTNYCFLKTKCKPSQRVRDVPWNVWVAANKKTGEVLSAFCECFAGYSTTCNHVAALLFKVDFAWRNGLTNPSCTSRECTWSAFAGKQSVEPDRVSEMTWSKPKFSRQASSDTAEGINPKVRRLFMPLSARSNESHSSLESINTALYPTFRDACAFQTVMAGKETASTTSAPEMSTEVEVESFLPRSLPSLAAQATSADEFLDRLPIYSANIVSSIKRATRGQSENQNWHEQRIRRVTGSLSHSVMTRGRKLSLNIEPKSDSLIKKITGQDSSEKFDLPSLKYGKELEPEAREKYAKQQRSHHAGLIVQEGGLFVDQDKVFLAASPDGLVSCECCGKGLVEIKCPFSIAHTAPSVENISYMRDTSDGPPSLQKNHPYYSQVQFQMGIIKRSWCDFFIYTRHGSMTSRISFDEERWQGLVQNAEVVFKTEIAKELVAMHSPNS
ncbi:uncharacterized protein LOC129266641 [Lytechinus pictus]|uniref:uncharacterized protein LOC129266641 n=1 Tax=Lytechinus pictus TaxID=7653 RepID=UPI0030B9DAED